MIDTMQLLLTDYDASGAKLRLQPSPIDTATGAMTADFPLWHDGTKYITGAYAYHRDEHFNVSLKPQFKNDGSGTSTSCYVRFEVPKFAGGNNYHPVDFDGTKKALKQAEKQLREVGIKTDIKTAMPCRLDAFNNGVMDEPYSCYVPVLSLMKGTRMKQRGYENGQLWENGRQQVSAYDKIQKMRHDRLSVEGLPVNTVRLELRLLEARKIRDALGFTNVRELLEDYDRIRVLYRDTMKKQLFKYTVPEIEVLFASELEADMMYYQQHYGTRWFQKYFMDYGMWSLLQKTSMETILDVVDKVVENKMKKSRVKRQLDHMRFASAALSLLPASSRTNGELYSELEEKLLAA